jgi:hypothetical protein
VANWATKEIRINVRVKQKTPRPANSVPPERTGHVPEWVLRNRRAETAATAVRNIREPVIPKWTREAESKQHGKQNEDSENTRPVPGIYFYRHRKNSLLFRAVKRHPYPRAISVQ